MPSQSHAFVSPKAEGGDATIVGPNEWNATHNQTVPDGGTDTETSRLTLAGSQQFVVAGTGRLRVLDPFFPFLGSYAVGTQSVRQDQYLLQYKQGRLQGNARLTLEGNAQLILSDFASSGRLVLAGKGN